MAKESESQKDTIHRVMHEYKHGELQSGVGGTVKNPRQAVAIALSEAGASVKKVRNATRRLCAKRKPRSAPEKPHRRKRKGRGRRIGSFAGESRGPRLKQSAEPAEPPRKSAGARGLALLPTSDTNVRPYLLEAGPDVLEAAAAKIVPLVACGAVTQMRKDALRRRRDDDRSAVVDDITGQRRAGRCGACGGERQGLKVSCRDGGFALLDHETPISGSQIFDKRGRAVVFAASGRSPQGAGGSSPT